MDTVPQILALAPYLFFEPDYCEQKYTVLFEEALQFPQSGAYLGDGTSLVF